LRKRGISTLDLFICASPSTMNFVASSALLEIMPVKKLVLPHWTGKLSNRGLSAWETLIVSAQRNNTALVFMHPEEVIPFPSGKRLLCATKKLTRKNSCLFPHLYSRNKEELIAPVIASYLKNVE
ncbi:hypothetical protein H0W26_04845, partial [Candidatus Dependentiae bacterium]|nr:hypothetical protein [Candidatus Dependentiae bacterium]